MPKVAKRGGRKGRGRGRGGLAIPPSGDGDDTTTSAPPPPPPAATQPLAAAAAAAAAAATVAPQPPPVVQPLVSKKNGNTKKDPAWKYCRLAKTPPGKNYVYVYCNFCDKLITGGIARLKEHLAKTKKNVQGCLLVPQDVHESICGLLKKSHKNKVESQKKWDEMVNFGSYCESYENMTTSPIPNTTNATGATSSRGIRGPMDRYLNSKNDSDVEILGDFHKKSANAQELLKNVQKDIGRYFFENAIPFNVVRSPSFLNMLRSVGNYGRGLKAPSMYDLTTWTLEEEVETTKTIVNDVKLTWNNTGVSILSDGWKDMRGRSIINFLVNCPEGTVFLKSVDASDAIKDAQLMFQLLDEVIETVGEDLVIQVVTDNASNYKAAGDLLMQKRKHLYWTPCAAHCIDLMLEKLGNLPQHKNALLKAKKVSNFIYNHGWVLNLMRQFTNKEIVRPAATRFATAYLTLDSMYQLRQYLREMFISRKWSTSPWAKKKEGKEVANIVIKDNYFWPSVSYAIKTTKPLVTVLRMVDGEKEPAMGFIYNAMDQAKEEIAANLGGEEGSYNEIWKIIDEKWEFQLHCKLHAAAYFLNPRMYYSDKFSNHFEVKMGLYACMEKLIKDENKREEVIIELDHYTYKRGLFGTRQARGCVSRQTPAEWWMAFGIEVPDLQSFAVKILSLTCFSSACERNWSIFNQIHTKRRNRLSTFKMNKLVYIMYNKKLSMRHHKKKTTKGNEDPLIVDNVVSDDEWVVGEEVECDENLANHDSGEETMQMDLETSTLRRGVGEKSPLVELVDEKEEEWVEVENDEFEERDEGINYYHDESSSGDGDDNDNPFRDYGNYHFGDEWNENDNNTYDDENENEEYDDDDGGL